MKTEKASLGIKAAAYAAGATAVLSGVPTPARAAIIYQDPADIAVPNTTGGIYLDLVTGTASTINFAGFDINPYGAIDGLSFYTSTADYVAPTTAGPASALAPGAFIGATDAFTTAFSGTNFRVTGAELLGLRFINSTTGATNYGWIEFTTTGATGFPATINRWAYEDSGASINAGQTVVPEPGSVAMVGAMGLGAAGLRAWRRRKAA